MHGLTTRTAIAVLRILPLLTSASEISDGVEPGRVLLLPDDAGALKVDGVPYPNKVINGLYFPTSEHIHDRIAYKKDSQEGGELWITKDPNGYWCVQPTDKKGTNDALMLASHPSQGLPENEGQWMLWESGSWKVIPPIQVMRCVNHICDGDIVQPNLPPAPAQVIIKPEDVHVPAPAPSPRAFDNSPGEIPIGKSYIMEEKSDSYSYKLWALLVLGGLGLLMCSCCLLNSENKVARSYFHNVVSRTVALVIGILLASQTVSLLTFGHWRSSWVIELIIFIIGFFMIYFITWKCQFSPFRRTIAWAFMSHVVACFGVAAYMDYRDAFTPWFNDDVLYAADLLIVTAVVLFLLSWIMKRVIAKHFSEPSPKSWPEKKASIMPKVSDRGCSRTCFPTSSADPSMPEPDAASDEWEADAMRGQIIICSIVLAVALYNFFRAVANWWGKEWVWTAWLVIIVIVVIIISCVAKAIQRRGEAGYEWQVDMMIVGTLSRVLGLCVVGAMQKLKPGLMKQVQEWFGFSAIFSAIFVVLGLSFLALLVVTILSRIFGSVTDDKYGALSVLHFAHYPEEVVGIALMLGVAWGVFLTGIVGDIVRFCPLFNWNEGWMQAVLCLLLAGGLYQFWRHNLLSRAEMRISHHDDAVNFEQQAIASIDALKETR